MSPKYPNPEPSLTYLIPPAMCLSEKGYKELKWYSRNEMALCEVSLDLIGFRLLIEQLQTLGLIIQTEKRNTHEHK